MNAVRNYIQDEVDSIDSKTLDALRYAGEEFVNKARTNKTYMDQTGNLRSSIGYVILKDGKVVERNFQSSNGGYDDGSDGITAAQNAADEVAKQYPRGVILIGVAGMNYAAAVESKGYDVITGSAPGDQELKELLGAIKP